MIELGSAKEPERTGVSSKFVGPHKNSAEVNLVNIAMSLANHGKDDSGDRQKPGRAAINDGQLQAGVGSRDSEPTLRRAARDALRSSLRKAKIDGIVPNMKVCKRSDVSMYSRSAEQRISRTQIQHPLETVKSFTKSPGMGLQGEYFTYQMLKNILADNFTEANWTSELRQFAGPDFSAWQPTPDEADASDFTYFDHDKTLLNWLLNNGILIPTIWQSTPLTFHIEVKSTAARSRNEPFHLSRLQKLKAERMTAPITGSTGSTGSTNDAPNEIFLIFRVYSLSTDDDDDAEARPGVQIYVDPGRLFEKGVLSCEVEGWLVGPV
jgi:hypothetical protein